MNKLLIFTIVLFVAITLLEFFLKKNSGTSSKKLNDFSRGYFKKDSVMNGSEAAFFLELQKQLPAGMYVFPKMRIADFIQAKNGVGFYFRRNKILPKHVDFLICDQYFKPIIAIELNGSSHHLPNRINSDQQKEQIFADAGITFKTVNVGQNFSQTAKEILSQKLI